MTQLVLSLITVACLTISAYAEKMNILVYPFKNAGDQKFAWISAGMTDTVIADLNRIKSVNVFSDEDRVRAMKEMELGMTGLIDEKQITEVGKVMGANLILSGTYTVSGSDIRIVAKLMVVETAKIDKTVKIDGTIEKIFALQDKIVFDMMKEAEKTSMANVTPARITDDEKKIIENKTRINSRAFELYSTGLGYHFSDPAKALDYYKKAIVIDRNYFNANHKAAQIEIYYSRFPEADNYISKAIEILVSGNMKNTIDYADMMKEAAELNYRRGNKTEAVDFANKAIVLYQEIGRKDTIGFAESKKNLGYVNGDSKAGGGIDYFNESLSVYEKLGLQNSKYYSAILQNLGVEYDNLNDYARALDYYFRAENLDKKLGLENTKTMASTKCSIGISYFNKKDYNMAVNYLNESILIHKKVKSEKTYDAALAYKWLADVNSRLKKNCSAVENTSQRIRILEYIKYKQEEIHIAKADLKRYQKKCGKGSE